MRARDVVFEQARGSCKVFAIVNDRKLPLAALLTAEEGRRVMGFLFHCKDEGSSQTIYRRASFQGFSIRAGGPVPLPGGISALRCERGPHDPDADHLFARLFYRDRLDEDMDPSRKSGGALHRSSRGCAERLPGHGRVEPCHRAVAGLGRDCAKRRSLRR